MDSDGRGRGRRRWAPAWQPGAVAQLERLAAIDPYDTTGARPLWGLGWKAYEDRNYSGAIGYWTVLAELYPQSNYNRGGLYWSARGHEKLGNDERDQELLQRLAGPIPPEQLLDPAAWS